MVRYFSKNKMYLQWGNETDIRAAGATSSLQAEPNNKREEVVAGENMSGPVSQSTWVMVAFQSTASSFCQPRHPQCVCVCVSVKFESDGGASPFIILIQTTENPPEEKWKSQHTCFVGPQLRAPDR